MDQSESRPYNALAVSSVLIGVLDHSAFFLVYACILFCFSVIVGYRWPRPISRWVFILAIGAPTVNIFAHLLFGFNQDTLLMEDAFFRFAGALLAILPGLGAGALTRRLYRRMRRQPSTIA